MGSPPHFLFITPKGPSCPRAVGVQTSRSHLSDLLPPSLRPDFPYSARLPRPWSCKTSLCPLDPFPLQVPATRSPSRLRLRWPEGTIRQFMLHTLVSGQLFVTPDIPPGSRLAPSLVLLLCLMPPAVPEMRPWGRPLCGRGSLGVQGSNYSRRDHPWRSEPTRTTPARPP